MSLLNRLFGRQQPPTAQVLTLTAPPAVSSYGSFNVDPWQSPDYRSGVDFVARQAAKLRLQPVRTWSDGTTSPCDPKLATILQQRWNPLQTAYDALYMAVVHLLVTGNAFVYVERSGSRPTALWPLHVSQSRFIQSDGGVYVALRFQNGRSAVLGLDDLLLLRRHYNGSDTIGDSPNVGVDLQLSDALSREIRNACQNSGVARGVIVFSGVNSEQRLEALRNSFVKQNFTDNPSGILFADQSLQYQPLETSFAPVSSADLQSVRDRLLASLGVNSNLVSGSFTSDEYGAFLESTIEPLALQLCLEMDKLTTSGETIVPDMSRLRFLSGDQQVRLIKEASPAGLLTINEGRQILGLPPLAEGGDQRLQSLNFVSAADALKYQLYKATNGSGVKAIEEKENTE